ncbi:MAG: hypothetical protein HC780_28630 [Leptolyngbyaceae cyanobacterium CSU_1_3]|nr:hypothetical protein [Leptolyngbyaceae cyanobacterium CSU_1_3]
MVALLGGCKSAKVDEAPIDIKLYQKWELQPGDTIAGYPVRGSLGDISIDLHNNRVYAPFDGKAQVDKRGCVIFSTPDVPAYLFRLCGLNSPKLGLLSQGDEIATGESLQFAALRKQPDGTWAIVEPAKNILERTLKSP